MTRTLNALTLALLLCTSLPVLGDGSRSPAQTGPARTGPPLAEPPRTTPKDASAVDLSHLRPFQAQYTSDAGIRRLARLEGSRWNQQPSWRYELSLLGNSSVRDEVELDAATLEPRLRRVSVPGLIHLVELWTGWNEVNAWSVAADGSAANRAPRSVEGLRYPVGALDLLVSGFALKPGQRRQVAVYSSDFGPDGNLWVELEALETVEVKAAGRTWATTRLRLSFRKTDGSPLTGPDGTAFPALEHWVAAEPPFLIQASITGVTHTLDSFSLE